VPPSHIIGSGKDSTLPRQFIQGGGHYLLIAQFTNGIVTLIIGKDKQDIRLFLSAGAGEKQGCGHEDTYEDTHGQQQFTWF
jgi:hypothetical protein